MRKLSKEEFVQKILELQRIRKQRHICNEADIHAIYNTQRIKKRTRHCKKGGTSYDASNY